MRRLAAYKDTTGLASRQVHTVPPKPRRLKGPPMVAVTLTGLLPPTARHMTAPQRPSSVVASKVAHVEDRHTGPATGAGEILHTPDGERPVDTQKLPAMARSNATLQDTCEAIRQMPALHVP